MKPFSLISRAAIAGVVLWVGLVGMLLDDWREARKKKLLGAAYEGPLDARDDN